MKSLAFFALLLATGLSFAGTGGGKVRHIMLHVGAGEAGVLFFKTEYNSNKAACSTADGGTHWAVSLDTGLGRAMYSLLLAAQAQQKTVYVAGSGDCASWGDRERPYAISVDS